MTDRKNHGISTVATQEHAMHRADRNHDGFITRNEDPAFFRSLERAGLLPDATAPVHRPQARGPGLASQSATTAPRFSVTGFSVVDTLLAPTFGAPTGSLRR